MALVRLDTRSIVDWPSFHEASRRAFRFPATYGHDMDAWEHCLASVRDAYGPVGLRLAEGELLYVELPDADGFERRNPLIMAAILESAAVVNRRLVESGRAPIVALMLN